MAAHIRKIREALSPVGLLLLISLPLHAADDHRPLPPSDTLDFNAVLESTLQQAPESRGAQLREVQATTYANAGKSWLASPPSLIANYLDDRLQDNRGQREIEYGVQLPLWRPGELAATRQLGSEYMQNHELWLAALRLNIAGRVRAMLADMAETRELFAIEQQATLDAERLHAMTTAQFNAGAVARLDVLQSENQLLQQRQQQLQTEALMLDAEIGYRAQTGLETRPARPHVETQHEEEEITNEHPLLRYLQSNIAVAIGNVEQAEVVAKGNPQLTVAARNEQPDRLQSSNTSISLSLSIPFGGKDIVAARTSSARLQQVDAEVAYAAAKRELQMTLHEAEHDLLVTRSALPLAQRQAAIDDERRDLAYKAFEAGELTLTQVLPAVQAARSSARALLQLQMKEQRLISEYNQALGVLP